MNYMVYAHLRMARGEEARRVTDEGAALTAFTPARELLGELRLAQQQPAHAIREFEASQLREPNRFRGLFGAGQAAAQSGDRAKAQKYFARLIEIAGHGSARPELTQARAFLDKQ